MEFAAALNISAGGALLHTRSFFPVNSLVTVRVPLSPVLGREHRDQQIEARVLRFEARGKGFDLAVEFASALITNSPAVAAPSV
jgi:PilZ domain